MICQRCKRSYGAHMQIGLAYHTAICHDCLPDAYEEEKARADKKDHYISLLEQRVKHLEKSRSEIGARWDVLIDLVDKRKDEKVYWGAIPSIIEREEGIRSDRLKAVTGGEK